MKKKYFSSFLLMGKVATLPLLIQSARADVSGLIGSATPDATPLFADIVTSSVTIMAIPSSQTKLKNLITDTSSVYGSNAYASALLCPSSANVLPTSMSVVVTGVKEGDTVFLFGALDRNDPTNLSLHPKVTIGNKSIALLGQASITGTSGVSSAVTIPVDLVKNKALVDAGRFYIQAATINKTATGPSQWGYSELDMIGVGQLQVSSYTSYCV